MPLAIISFVLFSAAGILQLAGGHAVTEQWLVIIGGGLLALAIGWPSNWNWRNHPG